jgi:(E)-4-hydroxy-3-methylbut-2-enyl-diphosphate synthase
MMKEGLNYPIHLGVTEAGDGLYARLKSAAGIAPLLCEGIGDTIRVSLTEHPVNEMPVAQNIRDLFPKPGVLPYHPFRDLAWDPFRFSRRVSHPVMGLGGGKALSIISSLDGIDPDDVAASDKVKLFVHTSESVPEMKQRISEYCTSDPHRPLVYKRILHDADANLFGIQLAGELGAVLMDGAIDAVWVENKHMSESDVYRLLLLILQATGSRISQTEYIACPSCGRTHFHIETRLKEIKARTSHLKHLKIGVMGCIVNGPGEMADADYGYVGSGRGKVSIYKGHRPLVKHVPEKEALSRLIALIKENGDWIDP